MPFDENEHITKIYREAVSAAHTNADLLETLLRDAYENNTIDFHTLHFALESFRFKLDDLDKRIDTFEQRLPGEQPTGETANG